MQRLIFIYTVAARKSEMLAIIFPTEALYTGELIYKTSYEAVN